MMATASVRLISSATQSFGPRLRQAGVLWSQKGGSFMAAAQAFYIGLAFFPLLILLISAVGFVLRFSDSAQNARQELVHLVSERTSPILADQVQQILAQVQVGAGFGGQIGLLTLAVSLLSIYYHMQKAFDVIWDVRLNDSRGVLAAARHFAIEEITHFLAWLGFGALLLLVFVSAIAVSVFQAFSNIVPDMLFTAHFFQLMATVSMNALIFALIYKTQPRVTVPWRDVWAGAVLASLGWEVGRQLLALFWFGSKYTAYGVVGCFLGLMVWLYIASAVLFAGAMLVRATGLAREATVRVDRS